MSDVESIDPVAVISPLTVIPPAPLTVNAVMPLLEPKYKKLF